MRVGCVAIGARGTTGICVGIEVARSLLNDATCRAGGGVTGDRMPVLATWDGFGRCG
jgi:hypothetical protein